MRSGTRTASAGAVTSATKVVFERALIHAGTESGFAIHFTRVEICALKSGLARVVHNEFAHLTAADETSALVSCIADSTLGKVLPSSTATKVGAEVTKLFMASSAPTFDFHLPFSMTSSRVRNTRRVDSGGKSFRIALVAEVAALRTTSPLSM